MMHVLTASEKDRIARAVARLLVQACMVGIVIGFLIAWGFA
jgi:uncharacterized RDD family membrane protein YckC